MVTPCTFVLLIFGSIAAIPRMRWLGLFSLIFLLRYAKRRLLFPARYGSVVIQAAHTARVLITTSSKSTLALLELVAYGYVF